MIGDWGLGIGDWGLGIEESSSPLLPISPSPHLPISPSPLLPISPSPLLPISPSPHLPCLLNSCNIKDGFSDCYQNSMIHLSPAATNEIGRLKSKQQPNILFRLRVKPGGCSGWLYDISFDEVVKVEDQVFDVNTIQLVTDKESIKYINGLTLDYSEDLMGGGFRFYNPIATSTCSCGNSFSINPSA